MTIPLISYLKRRVFRWRRHMTFSKRQQFVLVTLLLTAGLVLTQTVPTDWRYQMVTVLSLASLLFTAGVLREDIRGIEWLTLLLLPALFTTAVSLFYFLLPVRWLTRVPVATLYAIGIYALLLTENIYSVALGRSIALLRAAHSVGFLLTLVTYFLLVSTILSFHWSFLATALVVGVITFFLALQSLWAIELEERVSTRVLRISSALSIVFFDLSWVFSFIPVKLILVALFLTTCFYSSVGMAQQYIVEKLYKKTVIEFFSVSAIVFIIVLFASRWRGV